ncbi:class I SAM-dependent methyltransferase [Kutzneria kofuensis]|uniref:Ubiquinone/menaquinone biosynthesis C-methylase UbiE n=1 Tax=Kutzneria kofuensis TaxID=103725 RepID=A0A7W9NH63_9PSEU|nr:class I SAM-dependent methyltransferase [Kutzneria kofuensis]MBB5892254.1 ubiquinone/menaquinone biosynthesis C-methylase UbiE [Kutzneria kofuensis]
MQRYYERDEEDGRLGGGAGLLELLRTKELVQRYLPAAPASVVDVGGGTGVHARWLAELGHRVDLVDAVPLHVGKAADISGVNAVLGDARKLDAADASYDFVLMCGPLYHLLTLEDRLAAWREAHRVLKPGGHVAAATISRFSSFHDGLYRDLFQHEEFRNLVKSTVVDGHHRPPEDRPFNWFTHTYFHRPEESVQEALEAGFLAPQVFAIEGSARALSDDEMEARFADPERRERLLWALRLVETEPSVLGVSSHLLTVGRKG